MSILDVCVDDETPTSLWSPRGVQSRPNTSSSKIRISGRVPVVRALRLTWALPMNVLLRRAAIELWDSSECLKLPGSLCTASLGAMVWPRGLTQLALCRVFYVPIQDVSWPIRLEVLALGKFNQAIAGVVWPAFLKQLSLDDFNQPLEGVGWPASLQQLSFGNDFNQPLEGVVWPASLLQLSFGTTFNQPIAGVLWPTSLQQLSFGWEFNQPIDEVVWPASLQQLSLGWDQSAYCRSRVAGVPATAIVR
ncbi:unnamed protein product [Ectocarpus sp. 8 AP-2014]